MGDFKKGGERRFGGHGGGFNRDRDRGPVTMHQAICDQCGNPCEVPFKPTSGKPVYCNTCFGSKKEAGSRGGDRFSQRNYEGHKASNRPDFGSDISKGNHNEVKRQLEILNGKMDVLIKAVESIAGTKPLASKTKSTKVVKAVKTKKRSKK